MPMPLHSLFEMSEHTAPRAAAKPSAPAAAFEPALQRRELPLPPSASAPAGVTRKTIRDYLAQPVPALRPSHTPSKFARDSYRNVASAAPTRAVPEHIAGAIRDASRTYGVPESLIHAVVRNESAYNPRAVSRVGAQGLMQLMPGTAKELGVRNAFDVRDNVFGGTKYLRQMMDQFGDVRLAVAAYNAGPGAVAKRGNTIPNFAETQKYVARVMNDFQSLKKRV